jgi:hypothetical protein
MSSINEFVYRLQITDDGFVEMRFIDALSLLKNPPKLEVILRRICNNPPNPERLRNNFGRVPLTGDEALWVYVALACLGEFENLVLDAHRKNGEIDVAAATQDFETRKSSGFVELKSSISNNPSWAALIDVVASRMQDGGSLSQFTRAADSALKGMKIADGALTVNRVADFKTEVLLKFPMNMQVDNYGFMKRRFVDTSCASEFGEFVGTRSQSPKLVALLKTPRCALLRGQASFSLLGFNNEIANLGDYDGEVSGAQGVLNNTALRAQKALGAFDPVTPSPRQVKALAGFGNQAALELLESGEVGVEQALRMHRDLLASAETLIADPSSPYHNKYTAQDVIQMSLTSMLGSEGVGGVAEEIRRGLQSCLDQIALTDASLDFLGAYTTNDAVDVLGLDAERELVELYEDIERSRIEAAEDYRTLLSYANILFDVNAPELELDGSLRENPGPIAVACGVSFGIFALCALIYGIVDIIDVRRLRTCKDSEEAAKIALRGVEGLLKKRLEDPPTEETELDRLFKVIEDAQTHPDLVRHPQLSDCAQGIVRGIDCRKALVDEYRKARNFNVKLELLKEAAECFGVEAQGAQKRAEETEQKIAQREDQNPLTAWNRFLAQILNTGQRVVKYALYSALGLGVLWGSVKVYRSLRSSDS